MESFARSADGHELVWTSFLFTISIWICQRIAYAEIKNYTLEGEKKNFSSSYVKLSTVATTLANEAGLFPENYVAISGKLQNQKWILYCSSYFANLKASKDVLWHFQLNGSSKLLQSNCINFWKQEKPSSLVLLIFPYRNTFFLYRNIFFPFLYGNIWKYRRKKKNCALTLIKHCALRLRCMKLHCRSLHSRTLKQLTEGIPPCLVQSEKQWTSSTQSRAQTMDTGASLPWNHFQVLLTQSCSDLFLWPAAQTIKSKQTLKTTCTLL